MTREIRRFDAWGKCGTRFIIVESADHNADREGRESRSGLSRFATLTGCRVTPRATPGEYEIPSLRLALSDRKPVRQRAAV